MNSYTRLSHPAQTKNHLPLLPEDDDVNNPYILSPQDIIPAPDDLVIENAFWRQKPYWLPAETTLRTAILIAWEKGCIDGFQALDMLELHELVDHDDMLGSYLALLRARAAGEMA